MPLICSVVHDSGNIVVSWILLFAAVLIALPAAAAIKPEECLECHETFKGYNHNGASCVDCHSTITSLPHPDKLPRPACGTCHQAAVSSFSSAVHREKGMGCNDCHNVHYANRAKKQCASCHSEVKHAVLPSQKKHLASLACVACHGKVVKSGLVVGIETTGGPAIQQSAVDRDRNGYVSRAEWQGLMNTFRDNRKTPYRISTTFRADADSHSILSKPVACRACHSPDGYFKSAELQVKGPKGFTLPIDPTVFVPELPSQEEFSRTAHGRNGVVCADCHKSQKNISQGWSEKETVCVVCHSEVQEIYKASVHSKSGATRCIDCHNPHRVKSYKELSAEDRIAVCSRCHTNYLRRHTWLPNTALHFSYLECATCHSPGSAKSMVFYLARKTEGKRIPLSHDQLVALYGSDPVPALKNTQAKLPIDTRIGRLFTTLSERDPDLIIDASIIVTRVHHDYSETRLKEKECVTCHSGKAAFYSSMFFVVPGKEATEYIPVRGTLISAYPIGGFVDFFLLGEDKIRKNDLEVFFGRHAAPSSRYTPALAFKLIDLFGLLLVVLALCGICAHLVLRIMVKR